MKYIKDYDGLYSITEEGEVWSHQTNKFLKKLQIPSGYFQVKLCNKNHKKRVHLVHRLVLETFGGTHPSRKLCVNHKNSIKTDNTLCNLEWVSYRENMAHAKANGLTAKGERNGNSKLNWDLVSKIRQTKGMTYTELGEEFGISRRQVSNIINQRQWQR